MYNRSTSIRDCRQFCELCLVLTCAMGGCHCLMVNGLKLMKMIHPRLTCRTEYIRPLSPPLPLCHFVEAIRMPGVPGINEGRRAKTCARPSCTSCSTSLIHIRPLLSSCISLLPPGSQATPSTTATVQRYGHKEFLFGHIRIRRWHTSYWHVDGLATMSFFGLFKFLVELACRPTTTSSR